MKLYELTGMYLQLMDMMDDPDIDPDLIRDSMESLDGEIEEKADNIGMLIRNYEASYDAVDKEIKRLQAKKKSWERNIASLKNYLKRSMTAADKKKIKTDKFTFSIREGSNSAVVDEEENVPENFRVPQPDKILMDDLKKFLKEHGDTTYAHLKLGEPSLSIR